MNETRQRSFLATRVAAAWLGAVIAGSVLLAGGEAAATSGITLGVPQVLLDGGTQPVRPAADAYWISHEDCKNNIALQWVVNLTGGDTNFSWSASAQSTVCPLATGTTTTTILQKCWQPSTGATSLPSGTKVTIHAQDLVEGALGITNCDPSTAPASISWPQAVTIYFYYPSTNPTDTFAWDKTTISLVGPQPPSGVTLGVGDQELIANLPTTVTDANTLGYYFFCSPLTGDAGTSGAGGATTTSTSTTSTSTTSTSTTTTSPTDAGTGDAGNDAGTGDAGSDAGAGGAGTGGASTAGADGGGAGGSVASNCPQDTVIPGLDMNNPDINSPYLCGSQVPYTTTSYKIQSIGSTSLQNNVQYAVGVAAYDVVNNIGRVATLQCETPKAVDSFFPTYCKDGGSGCANGCGSCNVGSSTDPLWPALGGLALAGVAVMVRRERGRRSRTTGPQSTFPAANPRPLRSPARHREQG